MARGVFLFLVVMLFTNTEFIHLGSDANSAQQMEQGHKVLLQSDSSFIVHMELIALTALVSNIFF